MQQTGFEHLTERQLIKRKFELAEAISALQGQNSAMDAELRKRATLEAEEEERQKEEKGKVALENVKKVI